MRADLQDSTPPADGTDMGDLGAHLERLLELADAVEEHREPRLDPTVVAARPLPAGTAPVTQVDPDADDVGPGLLHAFVKSVRDSLVALACAVLLGAALMHVLPAPARPTINSGAIPAAAQPQP
jgi:hypothetical protein